MNYRLLPLSPTRQRFLESWPSTPSQAQYRHPWKQILGLVTIGLLVMMLFWRWGQPTKNKVADQTHPGPAHNIAGESISRSSPPTPTLAHAADQAESSTNKSTSSPTLMPTASTQANSNQPSAQSAQATPGTAAGQTQPAATSSPTSPLTASINYVNRVVTVTANQPLKSCTFIIHTPTSTQTFQATPQGNTCTLGLNDLLSVLDIDATIGSVSGQVKQLHT